MKKLIILIVLLFLASFVNAERIYSWGKTEDISLNTQTKTLHSFDGFDYVYSNKGYFDIWKQGKHQGRFSFGLFGEINSLPQNRIMSDFDWSWQIQKNTEDTIRIVGNNNLETFPWEIQLTLEKYSPLKIRHSLTNNTGQNVTNAQLFYLVDVNQETNPFVYYEKKDGSVLQYNYSTNKQFTKSDTNFEEFNSRISLGKFGFLFNDLLEDNFFITRTYFGNLNNLSAKLPDSNGFVVGVSKGNQRINSGQTVIADPNLTVVDSNDLYVAYSTDLGCDIGSPDNLVSGVKMQGCGSKEAFQRILITWDISSLPANMASATLNMHIYDKNVADGNTCVFDLNQISPTWNLLNGASQRNASNPVNSWGTIIGSWFDQTQADEVGITGDLTTVLNKAVDDGNGLFSMTILSQDDLASPDNRTCSFLICDTGQTTGSCVSGGSTDPFIEYSTNVFPDVNLNAPDGNQYIQGNSSYSIDFNVSDDGNELGIRIYYSSTIGLFENQIIDANILNDANISCDDLNFSDSTNCVFTWGVPEVDGNYFIDLNVYDGSDANNLSNSTASFYIDSTNPTITLNSPINNSTITNTMIDFNISDSNQGAGIDLTTITIKLNGVNSSIFNSTFCNNIDGNYNCSYGEQLNNGSNTITIDVNDNSSNSATQTTTTFTYNKRITSVRGGGGVIPSVNLLVSNSEFVEPTSEIITDTVFVNRIKCRTIKLRNISEKQQIFTTVLNDFGDVAWVETKQNLVKSNELAIFDFCFRLTKEHVADEYNGFLVINDGSSSKRLGIKLYAKRGKLEGFFSVIEDVFASIFGRLFSFTNSVKQISWGS